MNTDSRFTGQRGTHAPGGGISGLGDRREGGRRRGLAFLPVLAGLGLVLTGCRTFNYTDEDLARERRQIAEGLANGGWRGMGGGSGLNFTPNLGNMQCPGLAGGCPGR